MDPFGRSRHTVIEEEGLKIVLVHDQHIRNGGHKSKDVFPSPEAKFDELRQFVFGYISPEDSATKSIAELQALRHILELDMYRHVKMAQVDGGESFNEFVLERCGWRTQIGSLDIVEGIEYLIKAVYDEVPFDNPAKKSLLKHRQAILVLLYNITEVYKRLIERGVTFLNIRSLREIEKALEMLKNEFIALDAMAEAKSSDVLPILSFKRFNQSHDYNPNHKHNLVSMFDALNDETPDQIYLTPQEHDLMKGKDFVDALCNVAKSRKDTSITDFINGLKSARLNSDIAMIKILAPRIYGYVVKASPVHGTTIATVYRYAENNSQIVKLLHADDLLLVVHESLCAGLDLYTAMKRGRSLDVLETLDYQWAKTHLGFNGKQHLLDI